MQNLVYIVLLISLSSIAQVEGKIKFHILRQYDELESFKSDERSFYSTLKYFSLGERSFASFGGSFRFQAESFYREQFTNEGLTDHLWFLNRFMFHSFWNLNDDLKLFLELNSGTVLSKPIVSPVDKDVLAINQLFVQYQINESLAFQIGRENLMLGSRRLVDIREGPNVRRSFDIIRFNYEISRLSGTLLFGRPVVIKSEIFDNSFFDNEETLLGVFNSFHIDKRQGLDVYWLFQDDQFARYNSLTAGEKRHSLGLRHFGNLGLTTINNELVYQFGNHGSKTISAWTLSINLEHTLSIMDLNALIGVKTEFISGDKNPEDNKQNTFDALYPRGAYFGRVARFGPANLIDLHPYASMQYDDWFIELDYDAFWRYSLEDAVYNAALFPEYLQNENHPFIAHQLGGLINYKANDFWSLELESNIIFPGQFLKAGNRDRTLFHFVLTSEVKF